MLLITPFLQMSKLRHRLYPERYREAQKAEQERNIALLTPNCGFFFPTRSKSQTPAGCPAIDLDSDATSLETASHPTGRGSVPQDCPPSDSNPKCQLSLVLLTNYLQVG